MAFARRALLLSLCFCVLLPVLALPALASSEPSESSEPSPLSPVERVFQIVSLVILFGGIVLLPVYFVLNSRRKRMIASFGKDQGEDKEDKGE